MCKLSIENHKLCKVLRRLERLFWLGAQFWSLLTQIDVTIGQALDVISGSLSPLLGQVAIHDEGACMIKMVGLPFILLGDWNMPPEMLAASTFLETTGHS